MQGFDQWPVILGRNGVRVFLSAGPDHLRLLSPVFCRRAQGGTVQAPASTFFLDTLTPTLPEQFFRQIAYMLGHWVADRRNPGAETAIFCHTLTHATRGRTLLVYSKKLGSLTTIHSSRRLTAKRTRKLQTQYLRTLHIYKK